MDSISIYSRKVRAPIARCPQCDFSRAFCDLQDCPRTEVFFRLYETPDSELAAERAISAHAQYAGRSCFSKQYKTQIECFLNVVNDTIGRGACGPSTR